jgi:transposase
VGFLDEARHDNKSNSAKIYCKKGIKNTIIRNGRKFSINMNGFVALNGNSLLKCKRIARSFDLSSFYCEIRIVNMKSKENAGKLQLLVNKYVSLIKLVRNQKFDRKTINKKVLTDEIIDKKVKMFKEAFRKMKIENIGENINIKDLLDLKGLEEEITIEKFLKKELFKDGKFKTEKKLLNEFKKELDTDEWRKIFENEKKIATVLDNARTHVAKITKAIAEILNIKLVFLEKYSSDLNLIERVWYSIKHKISATFVKDEVFLMVEYSHYFYKYANSETLSKKWIETYIN